MTYVHAGVKSHAYTQRYNLCCDFIISFLKKNDYSPLFNIGD